MGRCYVQSYRDCKLHQVNPEKYLKDVLVRISTTTQGPIQTLMAC